MPKTCNNCGNIMEDDANICPRCGTQYIAIKNVQPEQTADNTAFQMPQYQQPYGQGYQQQFASPAEKPMGVGSWVGTILLTGFLGIISLILLFVWAFSNDVPIAKKNYCRAMLIVELILWGLSIIFIILFVVLVANSGVWEELIDGLEKFTYTF